MHCCNWPRTESSIPPSRRYRSMLSVLIPGIWNFIEALTLRFGVSSRRACLTLAATILLLSALPALCGVALDPTLELLVQKGIISREEAEKATAESALLHTNEMPSIDSSKWNINKALKNIEIYGDVRTRYEYREAQVPDDG